MIRIDSLMDPRVAPYRNLKDKELDRAGRYFIAEGEHLVRRLLASDFSVESVFVAEKHAAEFEPIIPPTIPLYVSSTELMNGIIGMKFHSGIIACGIRKPWASLDETLGRGPKWGVESEEWGVGTKSISDSPPGGGVESAKERAATKSVSYSPPPTLHSPPSPHPPLPTPHSPLTFVICPDLNNVENIGSLIRLSAGFGADALILGPHCHDPFWRQSIRVSMGTIFTLPIYRSPDLLHDLHRLKTEWGMELAATVLDETAEPLANAKRAERFGLLFGSEPQGLDDQTAGLCDRRITIPMKLGTDSLNVAVAAGIFLYHFTRAESFR